MMQLPDPGYIEQNTRIGAVRLVVKDISRMKRFYQDEIGLSLLEEKNGTASLGVKKEALVELVSRPESKSDSRNAGLYHMAILVPSRQSLADWLGHYIRRGNYLTGVGDHLVSEALYLSDPEGNGIEIYRDRPKDSWIYEDGRLRMDTLPIDLDKLLGESSSQDDYKMPAKTIMGHIHLRTSDIRESTQFYQEDLGFGLQTTFPNASFLSAGNYHHHIGINAWGVYEPRNREENQLGLLDYEIIFPDQTSLADVVNRLKSEDSEVIETNDESTKIIDPVGIGIKLRAEN